MSLIVGLTFTDAIKAQSSKAQLLVQWDCNRHTVTKVLKVLLHGQPRQLPTNIPRYIDTLTQAIAYQDPSRLDRNHSEN